MFTNFIIPYYAFKYKQGTAPKFWDFIRANVLLCVLNSIKAFFVLICYLIPFIVSAVILWLYRSEDYSISLSLSVVSILFFISFVSWLLSTYKSIRLVSFLTETVLFDKEKQKSILKQADSNTRGFFWRIILWGITSGILIGLILDLPLQVMLFILDFNLFIDWLSLIYFFYLQCFFLLWKTCFFFEIKKAKGEEISW